MISYKQIDNECFATEILTLLFTKSLPIKIWNVKENSKIKFETIFNKNKLKIGMKLSSCDTILPSLYLNAFI